MDLRKNFEKTALKIQILVAKEYGIPRTDIVSKSREGKIPIARHLSYYVCDLAGIPQNQNNKIHGLKKGSRYAIFNRIKVEKEMNPGFRMVLNRVLKLSGVETSTKKQRIIHELRQINSGNFHRMSIEDIIELIENEL